MAADPTRTAPDVVDAAAGIAPGAPLDGLRAQRAEIRRYTQGAHDALLSPGDPGGLTEAERAAAAFRVASAGGAAALARHYRQRLAANDPAEGAAASPRLAAILAHVDLLVRAPRDATPERLAALQRAGLALRDIVSLSQLVAFVSYQLRVVAGLGALRSEDGTAAPSRPSFVAPPTPYTVAALDWTSWLPVVDLAAATPAQLKALEVTPSNTKVSDYSLVLAHDPEALGQRTPLFNGIMYAPRGLPRAERELATVVVSYINGCVYCASVHARRFAELTKQPEVIAAIYREGTGAALDPRRRAIVDFAAALTREPASVGPGDGLALRAAGLSDLEILDLVHATAIFAWANRLMLSLGAPPAEGGAPA